MSSNVLFVVIGVLVALALAQSDPAFVVPLEHQLCSSADDCVYVPLSCCASSTCDNAAVNTTMEPYYRRLYQDYVSANCTAVLCIASICAPPPLECVVPADSNSRRGICQSSKPLANPCPPGVDEVNCLVDPCSTAKCEADLTATCKANYCGGCNAEFFDARGNRVNCSDVTDPIDPIDPCNGLPVVQCLNDPCQYAKPCPSQQNARCVANYCGGCNVDWIDAAGKKVECSTDPADPCNGLPEVNCVADPCKVTTCDAYPNATCRANYCGGCNAEFFVDDVQVECAQVEDPCNGLPVVNCLADPCTTAKCDSQPDAECRANYCGGCNAEFFLRGERVECAKEDPCHGLPVVNCFADPCRVTTCAAYPDAECRANYCGDCNAEFFVDGAKVDCEKAPAPTCPDGVVSVQCLIAPCHGASCPAHPNATCTDNYCGGCTPLWTENGREVDCEINIEKPPPDPCPPNVQQVQCLVDPCSVSSCAAYPHAECHASYCGDCRAIYTVEGRPVNCDASCLGLPCNDCLSKSYCSFCSGTYQTTASLSPETFGYCVSKGVGADSCVSAGNANSLMSQGATCPAIPGRPVSDHMPVQFEVSQSRNPILDKFVVLVTLVVNDTATIHNGLNLVRIFVDLLGSSEPSEADKAALCELLKAAVAKVDTRIPFELLSCMLNEKISVKRDVSYVADLAFPGGSNNQEASASALAASFALVGVAVALL